MIKSVMGMTCLLMEYLMSSCFHHVCFDYGEQLQMNLHFKAAEDEDFDVSSSTLCLNTGSIFFLENRIKYRSW